MTSNENGNQFAEDGNPFVEDGNSFVEDGNPFAEDGNPFADDQDKPHQDKPELIPTPAIDNKFSRKAKMSKKGRANKNEKKQIDGLAIKTGKSFRQKILTRGMTMPTLSPKKSQPEATSPKGELTLSTLIFAIDFSSSTKAQCRML